MKKTQDKASSSGRTSSTGSASRRSKYKVLIDGEGWTVSNANRFKFACCDCGLVHDMVIVAPKTRKGIELGFAVQRNKRATGQRRRWMRPNIADKLPLP